MSTFCWAFVISVAVLLSVLIPVDQPSQSDVISLTVDIQPKVALVSIVIEPRISDIETESQTTTRERFGNLLGFDHEAHASLGEPSEKFAIGIRSRRKGVHFVVEGRSTDREVLRLANANRLLIRTLNESPSDEACVSLLDNLKWKDLAFQSRYASMDGKRRTVFVYADRIFKWPGSQPEEQDNCSIRENRNQKRPDKGDVVWGTTWTGSNAEMKKIIGILGVILVEVVFEPRTQMDKEVERLEARAGSLL